MIQTQLDLCIPGNIDELTVEQWAATADRTLVVEPAALEAWYAKLPPIAFQDGSRTRHSASHRSYSANNEEAVRDNRRYDAWDQVLRGSFPRNYLVRLQSHPLGMIARVLLALALLATVPGLGQATDKMKVKVKQSTDPKATVKNTRPWTVVPSGPNSAIVWRRSYGTTLLAAVSQLEAYSTDKATFLGSQETVNKVDGQDLITEELVHFGGKPMLIGTTREPKAGRVTVYSTVLDPTLSKAAQPVRVCDMKGLEVKGLGSVWLQGNRAASRFNVMQSRDSSYLAIVSPPLTDGKSARLYYSVLVLDRSLSPAWQGTMELDAEPGPFSKRSMVVDSKGTVHISMACLPGAAGSEREKNAPSVLRVYSANAAGTVAIEVPSEGSNTYKTRLTELADGSVMVIATYGAKLNTIDGFLCGRVSKGRSEDIKRIAINSGYDVRNYHILDVLARTDGGVYTVFEVFQGLESDEFANPSFGDLRVVSLDAKGQQEWTNLFPTTTVYEDPAVGDRRPVLHKDKLYIFMVDSEKLAEKRKAGKEQGRGDMKDPYPIYLSYDRSTGDPSIKTILKSDKGQDYLCSHVHSVGGNRYMTFTMSGLLGGKNSPATVEFINEP